MLNVFCLNFVAFHLIFTMLFVSVRHDHAIFTCACQLSTVSRVSDVKAGIAIRVFCMPVPTLMKLHINMCMAKHKLGVVIRPNLITYSNFVIFSHNEDIASFKCREGKIKFFLIKLCYFFNLFLGLF